MVIKLNVRIAKTTKDKDIYDENKNDILKNKQEYYKQNKDNILKHQQEYYKQNKDEILEYKKTIKIV